MMIILRQERTCDAGEGNIIAGQQSVKKGERPWPLGQTLSQSYGFSSSHVWIWELDYKES